MKLTVEQIEDWRKIMLDTLVPTPTGVEQIDALCDTALAVAKAGVIYMVVAPDGGGVPGRHSWELTEAEINSGWTVRRFRLVPEVE
jgi:enoyl reductase-like protein